jgi:hypothetical protein
MRFALRFSPLRQTEGVLFLLASRLWGGRLVESPLFGVTADPTVRGLQRC